MANFFIYFKVLLEIFNFSTSKCKCLVWKPSSKRSPLYQLWRVGVSFRFQITTMKIYVFYSNWIYTQGTRFWRKTILYYWFWFSELTVIMSKRLPLKKIIEFFSEVWWNIIHILLSSQFNDTNHSLILYWEDFIQHHEAHGVQLSYRDMRQF